MTSTFTWLDYSDRDRRKMLEVMDLFREKDTRDELGIGSVRDAFADLLFPGTSTIQTRARYFLFVPWILQGVERSNDKRATRAELARYRENKLVDALATGGESAGVIGRRAKQTLKRQPSSVYWQGLRVWGIRLFPGQQNQYFCSITQAPSLRLNTLTEEDWAEGSILQGNWHPNLPPAPESYLKETTFDLARDEAQFLHECINARHSASLLAWLVRCGKATADVKFVWEHPQWAEFEPAHRDQLHHARLFSVVMWGGALLYNLLLAQKVKDDEVAADYAELCEEWSDMIDGLRSDLMTWQRPEFWHLAHRINPRISHLTKTFVECWVGLVLSKTRVADVLDLPTAHELIIRRERSLKGGQSRFDNARALDLWRANGTAAGIGQIDYRWNRVQVIVNDILAGLER